MKVDEVPENEFNCLGTRNEINHKRAYQARERTKQELGQQAQRDVYNWDKPRTTEQKVFGIFMGPEL